MEDSKNNDPDNPSKEEIEEFNRMMHNRRKVREEWQRKQEIRKIKIRKYLNVASGLLIAITVGLIVVFFLGKNNFTYNEYPILSKRINLLDTNLRFLENEINQLQSHIVLEENNIVYSDSNLSLIKNAELENLHNSINLLNEEINHINSIIMNNPTKILTIPLMEKDLINLAQSNEKKHFEFDKMIQRSETNIKWYFGIFLTFVIGLITTGFSVILKTK